MIVYIASAKGSGDSRKHQLSIHLSYLALCGLLLASSASPDAVASVASTLADLDRDGNGREDWLDRWQDGTASWDDLRAVSRAHVADHEAGGVGWSGKATAPEPGSWSRGQVRLLCFGLDTNDQRAAQAAAKAAGGTCQVIHDLDLHGGLLVLSVDELGLQALLASDDPARIVLDRDGRPALVESREIVGGTLAQESLWRVTGDWTASVAILDSGCDTAHDDLGDFASDDIDGPPPAVGHALDWFSAAAGWPVFEGYKVIGWHDVTDDYPGAAGPWDYHHHGTALAGVVAGFGNVDPAYRGLASGCRLTIVKTYDFDTVWHQWAGDFLAACAWILANRETYRIRVMLAGVNWDADVGISQTMADLLAAGILPVVPAGNDGITGEPLGYPAKSPAALTVGGVNDQVALAAFSGRGVWATPAELKPDLVAPSGGLLPSRGRITTTDNEPNDSYSDRRGTSLAAAHVAGAAMLLTEAMASEGIPPPATAAEAGLLGALLKSTAAPVVLAETSDGEGTTDLAGTSTPDPQRGWGLLQIHGALGAALHPLPTGSSVQDTLDLEAGKRVLARRLPLLANRSVSIVAAPTIDLDIVLEVHNSSWLLEPEWGMNSLRIDATGQGGAESVLYEHRPDGMAWVVVKHLAGEGRVTLRVEDAVGPATVAGSFRTLLGGTISAWPTYGQMTGTTGQSLLLTSYLDVDPFVRLVHALDAEGEERPGWPVFLFLPSSLSGPLSAPLIWELDGIPGDEVVVTSAFGKIFFLSPEGLADQLILAPSNVRLTAAVGIADASGQRNVVVMGTNGQWYRLSAAGEITGSHFITAATPLPPAVGQLVDAPGEEMAVAYSNGTLQVLDADGAVLPGWPVELGGGTVLAPVLVDGDGDGLHEVVVPLLAADGSLHFRVLAGDGSATAADDAVALAPGGGKWLQHSQPAVTGSHATGGPWVVTSGLVDNGQPGVERRWTLATASLNLSGQVAVEPLPSFAVRVTVPTGLLNRRWTFFSPPLGWDYQPGGGTEPDILISLGWEENIAGIPDLKGSLSAWFRPTGDGPSLAARQNLLTGGAWAPIPGPSSAALLPVAAGGWSRVTCQNRLVYGQAAGTLSGQAVPWGMARADGRNSGAFPLSANPATDLVPSGPRPRLTLWPNPGSAAIQIRWQGVRHGPATLDVFDLRGRRVRRLSLETRSSGQLVWDGRDPRGQAVAAGTYLFVLSHAGGSVTGRAVLTR